MYVGWFKQLWRPNVAGISIHYDLVFCCTSMLHIECVSLTRTIHCLTTWLTCLTCLYSSCEDDSMHTTGGGSDQNIKAHKQLNNRTVLEVHFV